MTALRLTGVSRSRKLSPHRRGPAQSAVPPYAATPVHFDGVSDYLTRGGALTGVANGKVWSGSIWLRLAALGTFLRAFNAQSDRFQLLYFGGTPADFVLFGKNAGGTEILRLLINNVDDTNWHHFLWS